MIQHHISPPVDQNHPALYQLYKKQYVENFQEDSIEAPATNCLPVFLWLFAGVTAGIIVFERVLSHSNIFCRLQAG